MGFAFSTIVSLRKNRALLQKQSGPFSKNSIEMNDLLEQDYDGHIQITSQEHPSSKGKKESFMKRLWNFMK